MNILYCALFKCEHKLKIGLGHQCTVSKVDLNESACSKRGRLGLDQVYYAHALRIWRPVEKKNKMQLGMSIQKERQSV